MILRKFFRRSAAVWLSPIILFLIVFFANDSLRPASTIYSLAFTVTGASEVFLIAPFCAACAAWEGGRLRRAGWLRLPRTRTVFGFVLLPLAPTLVVGIVSLIVAVLYQFRLAPAFLVPNFTVMAVACAVIIAHTVLGFAVGLHIRSVIAMPSILLLDYIWMVMPPAFNPLWLRHLTGAWTGCRDVTTSLDTRASLAVTLLSLGFAVAAFLLARASLAERHFGAAMIPIILSVSVGIWLVHSLGPDPVVPRAGSLVCSNGTPQVCVWPEHRNQLARIEPLAAQADAAWQQAGVPGPERYSELRAAALPPGVGSIRLQPSLPQDNRDILVSLAYGALPRPPACAVAGTAPWPGGAAAPYVAVWYADVAGVPLSALQSAVSPDVIEKVAAVRATPPADQANWVNQNMAAISDCAIPPHLEPPS